MKKLIVIIVSILIPLGSFSQSEKVKEMINEINSQWSLDENGNVTYVEIIEVPGLSKEEIFKKLDNYFSVNYINKETEIITKDIDNGYIIISSTFQLLSYLTVNKCNFTLNCETKDNKTRIILSLTGYQSTKKESSETITSIDRINNKYPIINKEYKYITNEYRYVENNNFGKAFYYSHKAALNEIEKIKTALLTTTNIDTEW